MNRVNAEVRTSETMIIKRENRLLWAMVIGLFLYSLYMNDLVNRTLSHTTPQSVYEACDKAKEAK